MWDLLKTLYEVLGASYPRASVGVAALVGALVFGTSWWLLGKQYDRVSRPLEAHAPASELDRKAVDDDEPTSARKYSVLERQINARLSRLDFPSAKTYDGYVMNYVFSFTRVDVMRDNPHHGHQGAPQEAASANEALLLAELRRRDEGSIYRLVAAALPPGYTVDWVYFRIIFDHRGVFSLLQSIEGNVIGPDGESRPMRRVIEGGSA